MCLYTIVFYLLAGVSQIQSTDLLADSSLSVAEHLKKNLTQLHSDFELKFNDLYTKALSSFRAKIYNMTSVSELQKKLQDKHMDRCLVLLDDKVKLFTKTSFYERLLVEESNIRDLNRKIGIAMNVAKNIESKMSYYKNLCETRNREHCYTLTNYASKLQRLTDIVNNLRTDLDKMDAIEFVKLLKSDITNSVSSKVITPTENCMTPNAEGNSEDLNIVSYAINSDELEDPSCPY
ncbi:uncharacterized protein LOC131669306 [Phymastichus coffea]|uniref:uncharacterized protein LOC131669306 n=1 Tax=Phymastichus coffea TaxID=108790 RepID=UPI00273B0490|nr:uncharacterized protein LOC131669306 [Phymastichus coffea]